MRVKVRWLSLLFCADGVAGQSTVTLSEALAQSSIFNPSTRESLTSTEFLGLTEVSGFSATIVNDAASYAFSKLSTSSAPFTLYMAQPIGCKGFAYYMGTHSLSSSSSHFTCEATLFAPSASFNCSDNSGTRVANISNLARDSSNSIVSISATIDSASAESVIKDGLMSWILVSWNAHESALSSISNHNADRHNSAKRYVAGMYFLLVVSMVELVALGTLWMNWLSQPLKSSTTVDNKSTMIWQNLLMWGVLFLLVISLVSIFTGFMGWVVAGTLLFFFIIGMNCGVYMYIRYKFRCCCLPKSDSPEDGSGLTGVEVEDLGSADKAPNGATDGSAEGSTLNQQESPQKDDAAPGKMPGPLHDIDFKVLVGTWICLVLTGMITIIVFFPGWTVEEYWLWDRQNFKQDTEYQPSTVAKILQMMYAWDKMATDLKFNTFADITTTYCGKIKREYLEPGDRQEYIYDEFIEKYNIDMSQYDPQDYNEYTSQNDWFIRKLAPGSRPICASKFSSAFPRSLTAPADGRVMAWQTSMSSTRYWIKNQDVDAASMLGSLPSGVSASTWEGGTMVVFRLAPQDYHRFHSPATGTATHVWEEGGTILSVNADATTSENAVFLNSRKIVIINTACCGQVAYIAIGAMCVGSVVFYTDDACTTELAVGNNVTQGSQLGIMQFGGSTVVMLFEPNRITLDSDIVKNTGDSNQYAETYMQMGEAFATY